MSGKSAADAAAELRARIEASREASRRRKAELKEPGAVPPANGEARAAPSRFDSPNGDAEQGVTRPLGEEESQPGNTIRVNPQTGRWAVREQAGESDAAKSTDGANPGGQGKAKAAAKHKVKPAKQAKANGAAASGVSKADLKALRERLAAIDDDDEFGDALLENMEIIKGHVTEIRRRRNARKTRLKADAEARKRELGLGDKSPLGTGSSSQRKPDTDGVIWPFGFTIKEDGLWYQPPRRDDNLELAPVWIAAS